MEPNHSNVQEGSGRFTPDKQARMPTFKQRIRANDRLDRLDIKHLPKFAVSTGFDPAACYPWYRK